MDETNPSSEYEHDELTADDLAVLQAFEAMEEWVVEKEVGPNRSQSSSSPIALFDQISEADSDEMLTLFATEADEDIAAMRQGLVQLEHDEAVDSPGLITLQRATHKLKGTAGSMGYPALSRIAEHAEHIAELIQAEKVPYLLGGIALVQAVYTLEMTLQEVVSTGQESGTPLADLEAMYQDLAIDLSAQQAAKALPSPSIRLEEEEEEDTPTRAVAKAVLEEATRSFMRVDVRRFEHLVLHTEQLAELRTPLESAQGQVEKALVELHAAQARLQRVEMVLSTLPFGSPSSKSSRSREKKTSEDERPMSSLVARILHEAPLRTGHSYQRKAKGRESSLLTDQRNMLLRAGEMFPWDELEIDRYTERDVLLLALSEAVADVALASTRVRAACGQLQAVAQKQVTQAGIVHDDTLLLRLAPLSTLIPRLERVVTMGAAAQQRRVSFEVRGEKVGLDQDILEGLKRPLLQLVRTCIAHPLMMAPSGEAQTGKEEKGSSEDCRVWFFAHSHGNEVTIEVGFSLPIGEEALDDVHPLVALLRGSIGVRSNAAGGTSFHLRLPRSPGAVQGLLVGVGEQRVVVPLSQVERIDAEFNHGPRQDDMDGALEAAHSGPTLLLNTLLGLDTEEPAPLERNSSGPYIVLRANNQLVAVGVDEIVGEIELVMKPLAEHLQRPGIGGTAIDGLGNVLLVLDVPVLMRHWQGNGWRSASPRKAVESSSKASPARTEQTVLIVDDSVSIRQSLRHTLTHEGYTVLEADDGLKAFHLLLEETADLLLLDMEMPNMNGYDLLSLLYTHPELSQLKVVILSSRSSEKHKRYALELGADAYLTKPCPQDVLLKTLKALI